MTIETCAAYSGCMQGKKPVRVHFENGVVIEEADEAVFWLELMAETKLLPGSRLASLTEGENQLLKIFSASKKQRNSTEASQRAESLPCKSSIYNQQS